MKKHILFYTLLAVFSNVRAHELSGIIVSEDSNKPLQGVGVTTKLLPHITTLMFPDILS